MKRGLFPGQEEAIRARFREIKEEGRRTANRRMFLGLAVGGVVCSGATIAVDPMRRWARPPARDPRPTEPDAPVLASSTPELDRALGLASGPIDELVAGAGAFLSLVAKLDRDDRLWVGWSRLASVAVDKTEGARASVRRLLLLFARHNAVPGHLEPWMDLVRRAR